MGKYIGNIVTDGGPTGYSCYFDGSTQYLNVADNAALDFGTGDFTIEFWFNPSRIQFTTIMAGWNSSGTVYGWACTFDTTSASFTSAIAGTYIGAARTITLSANTWYHFAAVRSGSTVKLYINGVSDSSVTNTQSVDTQSTGINIGKSTYTSNPNWFQGYVSNVRILKGTALYTANFTPPTQLANITNTSLLACQQPTIIDASSNSFTLTNTGGVTVSTLTPFTAYSSYTPAAGDASPGIWKQSDLTRFTQNRQINMYDPYWQYNTLLLNGNGTNGAQNNTFLVTPPGGVGSYTGSFNGSTQYLSAPNNSAFDFGTGDFTIEGWFYKSSQIGPVDTVVTYGWTSTTGGPFVILYNGSNQLLFFASSNGSSWDIANSVSMGTFTTGQWVHFAVSRQGSSIRLFLNGALNNTVTSSASLYVQATYPLTVGGNGNGGNKMNGYISNIRLVKGTAVYTANFTPPTLPLTPIPNTSLLTCQSATFIDNSPNNFTITNNGTATIVNPNTFPAITRTGTVTQGTFTPYGSLWSGYFSGSSQNLSWTGTALGSGDFTVECWFNITSSSANNRAIIASASSSTTAGWEIYSSSSNTISFYSNNANVITSSAVSLNTWYHVAAVRSGTTLTLYLNGVSVGTASFSSNLTNTTFYVSNDQFSQNINAYISNVRHVVGTAVYTSNFTPSIVPLTAITNTTALVCNSNYFRDNSANKYAITVTGSPYTQRYSPFVQNAPYEQAYYSGSCYFDAATSYLTSASTGALGMGTGDFTLEMWLWPTAFPNDGYMLAIGASNSVTLEIRIGWVAVHLYNGAHSDFHFQDLVPKYGQWQHFAVCRVSGTIYGYLNGVKSAYTVAFSSDLGSSSAATIMPAGNRVIGFASDIRVSNTALYTATFTPPTTPAVPTTSTALLVQGTNAGIADAAAGNSLITAGNAQISTTQSKYGGASMYFDGSGDYLTVPALPWTALGGTTFTIEAWVYITSTTEPYQHVFRNAVSTPIMYIDYSGGSNGVLSSQVSTTIATKSGVTPNAWHHVAIVRNGTSVTAFVDGVAGTPQTIDPGSTTAITSYVGWDGGTTPARYLSGYIDDLRITRGVARYTANFTPPTSQLQNC